MSAVTAIHEQHAAAKQRLAAARDEAAERLAVHDRATKAKASQLAEVEAAYVANATSEALGLEPPGDLPDASVLEKLRADMKVAEPVRAKLAANLSTCDSALSEAARSHKAAVASHLRDTAVQPALQDFHAALDAVRLAAVNLMAAHYLAYRKFDDKMPHVTSAQELFGPASEWLFEIRNNPWPSYPYNIRPTWLPEHGRFWPDEMPGVQERMAELLAEIGGVPA